MGLRVSHPASGIHGMASVYTNWYLIEEGGRLTVLDGGLPGDWQNFQRALVELGHSLADIDAVLITHHHQDHIGNAERLRTHGARVFSHTADAPFLGHKEKVPIANRIPYLRQPWYAAYMLRLVAKGITRVPAIGHLDTFSDGEVLDVPGSPRVIHAPGHTAGSCALFLEESGVLLTGDALVTTDVTRGKRRGPQIVRGPDTEDADLADESLSALEAIDAQTVLPGHGEPWRDGIKSAVEIARRRG